MSIIIRDRENVIRFQIKDDVTGQMISQIDVRKRELSLSSDDRASLESTNLEFIERVIELYRESNALTQRKDLLDLPVAVRRALEYLESDKANDAERELVFQALQLGYNQVKKIQRARAFADRNGSYS